MELVIFGIAIAVMIYCIYRLVSLQKQKKVVGVYTPEEIEFSEMLNKRLEIRLKSPGSRTPEENQYLSDTDHLVH